MFQKEIYRANMRYGCEIFLCYNQTEYEIRVIRSEESPYHPRSKKPARCTSTCSCSRSNVRVTFGDGRLQDCIKITVPVDVRSDSGERDWVYGRAGLQLDFLRHGEW